VQRVWHRSFDGWWYATVRENGTRRQLKLLKAPDTAEARKLAEEQLVRELSQRLDRVEVKGQPSWLTVGHVVLGFLAHSKREHDADTAKWYAALLTGFAQRCGKLRVTQLRKKHVVAYVKARYANPTSQNKLVGAIKRVFAWAVEEEHIPRSPIAHLRKPAARTRKRVLEPAESDLIYSAIRDGAFKDYFTALGQTGCRPGEVAKVTAAECLPDRGLWVLPEHKTAKKTGEPRYVVLTGEMVEMTRRLVTLHPDGPIFRNRRGKKWTRNAVRIRFRNLRKKFPQLTGVVAYSLRGTFATAALEAGVPEASVAALLGHSGTDTLHRFYSKLTKRVNHLQDAAAKASQGRPGGEP
jgi:integrase